RKFDPSARISYLFSPVLPPRLLLRKMPSVATGETNSTNIFGGHTDSRPRISSPLTYSGKLEKAIESKIDLTPAIGTEISGLQIRGLLRADDDAYRDLAALISQRGVVFLKNQDVTPEEMKGFM